MAALIEAISVVIRVDRLTLSVFLCSSFPLRFKIFGCAQLNRFA